ncbi:Asp-tRNA(Asn)/Glu-tRNA(Gln) amidotransferase subunit GatA [Ferrimicrobium sp.]|uniref:Asp-tRNA(Asn)/Glu-tRNA(Gln) amidotransferase subunit GatA n=1 Tax=Ferrimicrobium sp. TaxID=2926050 RepID=UPI002625338A|nr:Asp-tRNA(Asn)/Glu-tRNA(Gln) amidotransferase subunit GatA [Ferrimicrobium sp.]
MNDEILDWGIAELQRRLEEREITTVEVIDAYEEQIAIQEPEIDAFLSLDLDAARSRAAAQDARRARGEKLGRLAGVPVALKDNLCTTTFPTTAASKILQGWIPPYNATVVDRITDQDGIVLGKTNLDEFAMGSSTENSAYKITKNPYDLERVPGGSSGGSAAAVASRMALVGLGSDTGGSIRQPAALTGIVGFKPTYGRVSRYGLLAFASSLDQIGPLTASVEDAALVAECIMGHDPRDATSLQEIAPTLLSSLAEGVRGVRIGVVTNLVEIASPEVQAALVRAVDALQQAGATVTEIRLDELAFGLAAYYVVAPAEASSNLARYDGVRYGLRESGATVEEMMIATRTKGFGPEVKRRIMLGTYALSAGYYDAFYVTAQRVRSLVRAAFDRAYTSVDLLLSPTSPTTAFRIGERAADPVEMYRSDICTIPSNLSGDPALSIPAGVDSDGLPIGVQLLGPARSEQLLFRGAYAVEEGLR